MYSRDTPGDAPADRMGWFESVRVGGWRGGKFKSAPVHVAYHALQRGVRGKRRRAAATKRVATWCLDTRSRGNLTFDELAQLLEVEADPDVDSKQRWCFIDLELDSAGRISELGVALVHREQLIVAEGTLADLQPFDAVLKGRWPIAHNGEEHDFPILERAGAHLPALRADSMRLAWIAWPTAAAHSLGALAETKAGVRIDMEQAHHAGADAAVLARLWAPLLGAIGAISAATRGEIVGALSDEMSTEMCEALFGRAAGRWSPPEDAWHVDSGAAARGHRVQQIAGDPLELELGETVLVVDDLRQAVLKRPQAGLVLQSGGILRSGSLAGSLNGWHRGVALRLLEEARGVIALGPPALAEGFRCAARAGDQALVWPGAGFLTDRRSVAAVDIDRPMALAGGLSCLFEVVNTGVILDELDMGEDKLLGFDELSAASRQQCHEWIQAAVSGAPRLSDIAGSHIGSFLRTEAGALWVVPFPDPTTLPAGVSVLIRGGIGSERSRALWRLLLGDNIETAGAAAVHREWNAVDGLVAGSQQFPGRRVAQLLPVAAAYQAAGESVVVTDELKAREAIIEVARDLWHEHTDTPLIRPPYWPTVDEACRRFRTPHTALVGAREARELAPLAGRLLVSRAPMPTLAHPTLRRMLEGAEPDPFGIVIEPLAAHLTAELITGAGSTPVAVADPLTATGVLADLLGRPTAVRIEDMGGKVALRNALLERLSARYTLPEVRNQTVRSAVKRLLDPGEELRDFQRSVIEDVIARDDVMAIFRTGLGKSLCYQVPALAYAALDAVTIVISPLLALQRDQISSLRRRGVFEAAIYNSALSPEVRRSVRRGVAAGFYRIIFVAPEALAVRAIARTLGAVPIALVAIDEAHCISEMGHDFRPDYRTIPTALKRLLALPPDVPLPPPGERPTILALTGTAAPQVQGDIREALS